MYNSIKKLSLSFIILNLFIFQSLKADMMFYYSAAILPSVITKKQINCFNQIANYTPVEPIMYPSSTSSSTTIIALHGKNGSPLATHMVALASDLNQKGYDVILPYMPWSGFTWDGTYCNALSHLNDLIAEQHIQGKDVILLGHSLGAPIALAYSVREDVIQPNAVVAVAPGHFIHQSSLLASYHAQSIELAHTMVDANQSSEYTIFETWNAEVVEITTTPEIYLSFHDPDILPNITSSISLTTNKVLWLAGIDDPLTSSVKSLGIYDAILSNTNYTYNEVPGNHITVVYNVADELDSWYSGL